MGLQSILHSLWKQYADQALLDMKWESSSRCASYEPFQEKFCFYPIQIQKEYKELQKSANSPHHIKEFIEWIFFHEYGHFRDPYLKKITLEIQKIEQQQEKAIKERNFTKLKQQHQKQKRLILEKEKRAWDFAIQYIPEERQISFLTYAHRCLQSYQQALQIVYQRQEARIYSHWVLDEWKTEISL